MEYHLSAGSLSLLLFLYCLLRWKNRAATARSPPQPSGSWPIIGHLHLLDDHLHKSLGKMADKYGPIFMIKLGVNKALTVSSPAMARECLSSNDRVFVDRPQTIFAKHLGYDFALLPISPYGPYWREMRKIITVELLSNHRLEMFKDVRVSEVRSAVKEMYDRWSINKSLSVDMKLWFNDIILNNIVRLIAGKSLKEFYQDEKYDKISKAFREMFEMAGAFAPADMLPILKWFDIGGYEKAMKNLAKDVDHVAQAWLDEHKRRSGEVQENQDLIDVLLRKLQTEKQESTMKFEADAIIKATSLTMILAATDTTTATLTWALSLLLNNKDALKKTQAELDSVVGKERQVDETDLKNLVYLQAVLKETLRLYPAAPISVPRISVADSTVNGYHIPEGTQLFVNVYKIHRDPKIWQDPSEFRPERFLTTQKDYDIRGQNFDYMPFGGGRRICPGISFGVRFMQLTLASLLHGFTIYTPMDKPVDMTGGFGIINLKATPLDVTLTPRLPDYVYKLHQFQA